STIATWLRDPMLNENAEYARMLKEKGMTRKPCERKPKDPFPEVPGPYQDEELPYQSLPFTPAQINASTVSSRWGENSRPSSRKTS
ncbi:MAG: hypothetical protein PHV04_08900, partial [Clostridia bacterium]|nr:hypothetical protein [Clostridia bacterium]